MTDIVRLSTANPQMKALAKIKSLTSIIFAVISTITVINSINAGCCRIAHCKSETAVILER